MNHPKYNIAKNPAISALMPGEWQLSARTNYANVAASKIISKRSFSSALSVLADISSVGIGLGTRTFYDIAVNPQTALSIFNRQNTSLIGLNPPKLNDKKPTNSSFEDRDGVEYISTFRKSDLNKSYDETKLILHKPVVENNPVFMPANMDDPDIFTHGDSEIETETDDK